jgi:hypothetical protein
MNISVVQQHIDALHAIAGQVEVELSKYTADRIRMLLNELGREVSSEGPHVMDCPDCDGDGFATDEAVSDLCGTCVGQRLVPFAPLSQENCEAEAQPV